MRALTKKSIICFVVSVVFLLFALWVAADTVFIAKPKFEELQTRGVSVSARVIHKYKESHSCGRSTCSDYLVSVLYFDKPPSKTELVDLGFGVTVEWPIITIGDSHSAAVSVSRALYSRTNTGDELQIIYLPENFETVYLAELPSDWTLWSGGLWFSFSLAVVASLLLIVGAYFRRQEATLWATLGL